MRTENDGAKGSSPPGKPELHIPNVTLCCVDTLYPGLGLDALLQSMQKILYGEILFFTDRSKIDTEKIDPAIRIIDIGELKGIDAYSLFILQSLGAYIRTSHALVIQWDGFVTAPQAWNDAFLAYDYVGATWPMEKGPGVVGNGGFSLRSAKLLRATASNLVKRHHPEDDCIAKTNRSLLEQQFGIRFAEPELADVFSYEFKTPTGLTFGFHGMFHFPDVMSVSALHRFVKKMPTSVPYSGYFPVFLEKLSTKAQIAADYREVFESVTGTIKEAINQASASQLQHSYHLARTLIDVGLLAQARALIMKRVEAMPPFSFCNIKLIFKYIWRRVGPTSG